MVVQRLIQGNAVQARQDCRVQTLWIREKGIYSHFGFNGSPSIPHVPCYDFPRSNVSYNLVTTYHHQKWRISPGPTIYKIAPASNTRYHIRFQATNSSTASSYDSTNENNKENQWLTREYQD